MVWLVSRVSKAHDQNWIVLSVQATQEAAVGMASSFAKAEPDALFGVFAQVAVVRARVEVDVIGDVTG
jgi:hypothetical protein